MLYLKYIIRKRRVIMNLGQKVKDFSNEIYRECNLVYWDRDYENDDLIGAKRKFILELFQDSYISLERPDISQNELSDVIFSISESLILSSVNYCFWSGLPNLRSGNASAGSIYKIYADLFRIYKEQHKPDTFSNDIRTGCRHFLQWMIPAFYNKLLLYRFPHMEARYRHLEEVRKYGDEFIIDLAHDIIREKEGWHNIETLISVFPGFGDDIFLKRAFLFAIQLYRYFGFFDSIIDEIPVPADYHIPNVLQYFKFIRYNEGLKEKIKNKQLLPSGSIEEMSIRAATILVCDDLARKTGWPESGIDEVLFGLRKQIRDPFHLTVTTHY